MAPLRASGGSILGKMKEMGVEISVTAEAFPLAEVFTISRGSRTEAKVLTVEITEGGKASWHEVGALGVAGVPLPGIETGIAASALVLGLAVALAIRPPLWAAALVVAAFAVFHGHAHGAEMPAAASPLAYAAGFVVATGLLHLAGIALGELSRWRAGRALVRAGGGAIALAGLAFLTGAA